MNTSCKICGAEDLFSAVTGEGLCSVCTLKFFGGGEPTAQRIQAVRARLGLFEGEFLKQDHGAEAARILGRRA